MRLIIIIIIGAGTSSLTLVHALPQLAPLHEVELFERDASAAAQRRGYATGWAAP